MPGSICGIKFYLEGDARIGLRDAIAREMLVNTLIHREFTSSYIARFVIEKDRMFTENANRAVTGGVITPDDFEPNPKKSANCLILPQHRIS